MYGFHASELRLTNASLLDTNSIIGNINVIYMCHFLGVCCGISHDIGRRRAVGSRGSISNNAVFTSIRIKCERRWRPDLKVFIFKTFKSLKTYNNITMGYDAWLILGIFLDCVFFMPSAAYVYTAVLKFQNIVMAIGRGSRRNTFYGRVLNEFVIIPTYYNVWGCDFYPVK